ncbi:MAG: hypothetical protein ACR2KU_12380 [Gammaproteobacteria bacterium]|nr:hypothetical protein [Gammaproteobacteria bacterium]
MNILVIGKGKTGTTIISKSIQASMKDSLYYLEPKKVGFFMRPAQPALPCVVKIIYEHWDPTPNLREAIMHNELPLKFKRIVAIVRDLRDEAISRLFYIALPLAQRGVETRLMDAWLDVLKEKERDPHAISFLGMIEQLNGIFGTKVAPCPPVDQRYLRFLDKHAKRIHVIKYEDFIEDRLDSLESYLGFEVSDDRHVGEYHWTRRTAAYNNWKRFFTPGDVEQLRDLYEPLLIRHGYTDWALDPDPVLKPDECSGYVRRIVAGVHAAAAAPG